MPEGKGKNANVSITDITDQPFDKIAIDLITDLNVSTSGNQHILVIIDHLMGCTEALPKPDKKADTIVCILINNYLLVQTASGTYFLMMELNPKSTYQ